MLELLQKDKYLTLYRKAMECSIHATGMTDLEGTLIYVNEAAQKLWGYNNKQEMLGRLLPEFWEGDRVFQTLEELHCKGYSKWEDIGKRKDGSLFNVEYSASIIRDDFGEPLAMVGSFFDITERKTAQQASKKKQQELEAKSKELEEVNAALKVLLKKREDDKIELENKVLSNIKCSNSDSI
jgi:PAS domain S-box-containing protein